MIKWDTAIAFRKHLLSQGRSLAAAGVLELMELSLTTKERRVLALLRSPDWYATSEVAKDLGLTHGSAFEICTRLQTTGFVKSRGILPKPTYWQAKE
jgi:DNA-binding MarR family transcriptional regulator